jgi:hypothetical protein
MAHPMAVIRPLLFPIPRVIPFKTLSVAVPQRLFAEASMTWSEPVNMGVEYTADAARLLPNSPATQERD